MPEDKKDGGPAFPSLLDEGAKYVEGMSLRDYAAIKLAAGTLAAMNPGFVDEAMAKELARSSYRAADALLAERSKP